MGFAGKRKQIKNSLSAYSLELIERAGIDPKTRPQELSIEDWIRLYKLIVDSLELIEK
jgi:16S rRNA A1518/A1519 N6-dimethyltransferase RsmA/KsgA/DIM1 with predicted DNA glycosylase/AP lyase activity